MFHGKQGRHPTYMTTVMLTATFAGLAFDNVMNGLWDMNNRGKQWKDIKNNYAEED
uniref:Complex III subunit 9 n=1 Tax=Seriola lalandi dorsalis TaxID=1841481 RepID=A0A3B4WTD4_SERLL